MNKESQKLKLLSRLAHLESRTHKNNENVRKKVRRQLARLEPSTND